MFTYRITVTLWTIQASYAVPLRIRHIYSLHTCPDSAYAPQRWDHIYKSTIYTHLAAYHQTIISLGCTDKGGIVVIWLHTNLKPSLAQSVSQHWMGIIRYENLRQRIKNLTSEIASTPKMPMPSFILLCICTGSENIDMNSSSS